MSRFTIWGRTLFRWNPIWLMIGWFLAGPVIAALGQGPGEMKLISFALGAFVVGSQFVWLLELHAISKIRLGEPAKPPWTFWLAVGGIAAAAIALVIEFALDPTARLGTNDAAAAIGLTTFTIWFWSVARVFTRAMDPATPAGFVESALTMLSLLFLPFTAWHIRRRALNLTAAPAG